jgi:hypothetical protein
VFLPFFKISEQLVKFWLIVVFFNSVAFYVSENYTQCTSFFGCPVKVFHFAKNVEYAYQELPHPENTTSPHSQEEERKREHGL